MALVLRNIREAFAEQIANNVGRGTNVYAYPPESPQYPAIVIRPAADYVGYHETMEGGTGALCRVSFDIDVAVVAHDDVSAQIALDDYLSAGTGPTSSVFDAFHVDLDANSTVDTVRVNGAGGARRVTDGAVTVFVATVSVDCWTRRV